MQVARRTRATPRKQQPVTRNLSLDSGAHWLSHLGVANAAGLEWRATPGSAAGTHGTRALRLGMSLRGTSMLRLSILPGRRPARGALLAALLILSAGAVGGGRSSAAAAQATAEQTSAASGGADDGMAHMSGHMHMTTLRPANSADQKKAAAVVNAAKVAMTPYQDYQKALAAGYKIFLPNIPQSQYHFTNYTYALEARSGFDPLKPTSLLYKKTPDGGYKLVGAMYTDRVDAPEEELNERIPLSVARWHQHINFCKAPALRKAEYFGADAKFGLLGSITTQEACEAAGGEFHPHIFGWMVHVYPYETDAKKIWSTNADDEGHDNMDHSAMPGMKMD